MDEHGIPDGLDAKKLGELIFEEFCKEFSSDCDEMRIHVFLEVLEVWCAGEDVHDELARLVSKPFMDKLISILIKYENEEKP